LAVTFRAEVLLNGKTATGFEVPEPVVESLGRGRRVPVRITVGPHTYRTTIARMGGRFLVPLSAENRTAAGVTAGQVVDVTIDVDDEPRVVDVPDDLATALAADPVAAATWTTLSYTHQREHVDAITGAKKPETRERRVAKAIEMLRGR
jgi:hypothetical protein